MCCCETLWRSVEVLDIQPEHGDFESNMDIFQMLTEVPAGSVVLKVHAANGFSENVASCDASTDG